MHGADDDVDVVALDQLVDVVDGFRRLGFVVDLEILELTPAELAALLLDVEAEPVLDRVAECRVRAGVRQHEPDLDLALRVRGGRRDAKARRQKRAHERSISTSHLKAS